MLFAEWRLLFSGAADACVNMAIDEATLILVSAGRAPPTVRIYYWEKPCYTLGHLQFDSDLRTLLNHGDLQCVRRLTGGKAYLHGGDISYSLIVSMIDTLIPSSVSASYEHISSGVIEGLRLLGIDARHAPPTEVQVDAHIVATAAQARRQGVLLHQGTIALGRLGCDGSNPNELSRPTDRRAAASSRTARAHTGKGITSRRGAMQCPTMTPLSDLIGGAIAFEDAAKALGMGFERALGVDLSPGILFAKEKRLARQLVRDKYMQPEWTWRSLRPGGALTE